MWYVQARLYNDTRSVMFLELNSKMCTYELLDRFRALVLPNVLVIDDCTVNIEAVLRMVNVRQLVEAAELARILYLEIKPNLTDVVPATPYSVNALNQLSGMSYWTRQLLQTVVEENQQDAKEPVTKAYEALCDVLQFTKRKAQALRNQNMFEDRGGKIESRIRSLPSHVRTFYEYVDWALPPN
jgi:hypothetical protein